MTTLDPVNEFVSDVKDAAGKTVARVEILKPCLMLSRYGSGVDYSVERKVVLRVRLQYVNIDLFWIKGHTGWVHRGASGYHEGSIQILGPFQGSQPYHNTTGISLNSERDLGGEKRLSKILKTDKLRSWVMEKMTIPSEVVDLLKQSHTVVVHKVF